MRKHSIRAMANSLPETIPPQNLEAERSLLGAILSDREAINRVIDMVTDEHFYQRNHQLIWNALASLWERRENIDILSASTKLADMGYLDAVGGVAYLTALASEVPTAAHVQTYARIVQRKKSLRDLLDASHRIKALAYREDDDIDAVLGEAEQQLFSVTQRTLSNKFDELAGELDRAMERIQTQDDGQLRGVPTRHTKLDQTLGGFQKSDLVILAARPSVGKTAFAIDIARRVAENQTPVGIFSLEMSVDQVVDRLIASTARTSLWRLRTGKLSHEGEQNDFLKITNAISELRDMPVFIDDTPGLNVMQMRAMARRLKAEHGLGILIVDYLQLMSARRNYDSPVQQVTEISRGLKGLAKELQIPVIALSQLSRAVENREGNRPRLSDLRDSGSIEQDADVVMFIHRDDKINFQRAQEQGRQNLAQLIIAKHRNGPTGEIDFHINPENLEFSEIDTVHTDSDFL
ncbi:MAG: replicative DNA helicase [Candidatus Yanofskybacteria bacterium]|nr:replicative DNA helicase [Candidatus Yanofskybacteria bacterium]